MDANRPPAHLVTPPRHSGQAQDMALQSASLDNRRSRASADSWIEISSQPSSSSHSSTAEEIVTTGLKVQSNLRTRRRRTMDAGAAPPLMIKRSMSTEGTSSQEEYEESESESDRVMTSSGEGPVLPVSFHQQSRQMAGRAPAGSALLMSDDEDENRTAINYPINKGSAFTPQPNAFSHPPSNNARSASQPVSGSYFPPRPSTVIRPQARHSMSAQNDARRQSHLPQNLLSPSYNAAAEHEEALRASLNSLLSVAAAARGHSKPDPKKMSSATRVPTTIRSHRVDPSTLRLVPESALPPQFQEPTFKPTIRRQSTNSISTTSEQHKENKRKDSAGRSSSKSRALKKARRYAMSEDPSFSPTLLTWLVSAGVLVIFSALSFSAGYSVGREAGLLEAQNLAVDEQLRSCAREAGRSSLGLKRSLAMSAVQV